MVYHTCWSYGYLSFALLFFTNSMPYMSTAVYDTTLLQYISQEGFVITL